MPGRPENPIEGDGPVQTLAHQLRLLKKHAGLTLRDLQIKTGYAPSTLSEAMSGRVLPSWDVTSAVVRACGGNAQDWRERWRDAEELSQLPPQLRTTEPFWMPRLRRVSKYDLPVMPRLVAGPPPLPLAANTPAEFARMPAAGQGVGG